VKISNVEKAIRSPKFAVDFFDSVHSEICNNDFFQPGKVVHGFLACPCYETGDPTDHVAVPIWGEGKRSGGYIHVPCWTEMKLD